MRKNRFVILILALILSITSFTVPGLAQSVDKSELDELKQMIQELKKDNEEKTKEIEALRKENSEKIEALESRINQLGEQQEKPKMVAERYKEHSEEEEDEDRKDEFYADPDKYTDSYSFFDRIDKGDKPYKTLVSKGPFRLEWGGYADLLASWYDHGPDQTRPGGSEPDSRLEFNLARFVLELEGEMRVSGLRRKLNLSTGAREALLRLNMRNSESMNRRSKKAEKLLLRRFISAKSSATGDYSKPDVSIWHSG